METKKPSVMKTNVFNSAPKAAKTASINLFKKFEIAKSEQRFLKGGNDIIIDDTVDSIIIDDTLDN